jgi:hypothetical protein
MTAKKFHSSVTRRPGLVADKSVPEAEKKGYLVQLENALKMQSLFSSRKTSRWC